MAKKNLLVICGGQSEEHDISLLSAATVLRNLDPEKYNVKIVGITKTGRWLLVSGAGAIADGSWELSKIRAFLLPDASEKALLIRAGADPLCGLRCDRLRGRHGQAVRKGAGERDRRDAGALRGV